MDNLERTIEESIYHERHNIIEQCRRRMKLGETNYGEKDVCLSEVNFLARNIFRDMEEEKLDGINYKKLLIIDIRYAKLQSKPRGFNEYITGEMQSIDEDMMQYTPLECTTSYEETLLESIHNDIVELTNLRIQHKNYWEGEHGAT